MVLGDEVKIARIKKGWSQTELAKKSNVAISTIYLLEKNNSCNPQTLFKVCKALGLNFKDMYALLKEK